MTATDPRYPIGPLQLPDRPDEAQRGEYLRRLRENAQALRQILGGVQEDRLSRTYREGSFTVRQLVHHIADAHEHGFMRFRWGLTEQEPTILPFDEVVWAHLPDYALPPQVSLQVFEGVNERWITVLESLSPSDLERRIHHPQEGGQDLWRLLAKHEWHVRHHLGHIRLALGHDFG